MIFIIFVIPIGELLENFVINFTTLRRGFNYKQFAVIPIYLYQRQPVETYPAHKILRGGSDLPADY
jgi:hypothetical protein